MSTPEDLAIQRGYDGTMKIVARGRKLSVKALIPHDIQIRIETLNVVTCTQECAEVTKPIFISILGILFHRFQLHAPFSS